MKTETYSQSLDELQTDLLVTAIFSEDRPPHGIAGLIDWRLNGFLSRVIKDHKLTGQYEEATLTPLHKRLPARRLLVMGLGKKSEFTAVRSRETAFKVAAIISDLKCLDVSIYIPPSANERIVGTTQRAVFDAFNRSNLPDTLLIRWLDFSLVQPLEFGTLVKNHPSINQGASR